MVPKPDEALILIRLLNEARRKSDGTTRGMMNWLGTHKLYMATDADTRLHDHAMDFLALDDDAFVIPKILKAKELKAGMVLENGEYTVLLTTDPYIDPADNTLTVDGTPTESGNPWRATIDPEGAYFVQPASIAPPKIDYGMEM